MFKLVPSSNQLILADRLSYLLKAHVSEFELLDEAIENAKMITEREHIEILVCNVIGSTKVSSEFILEEDKEPISLEENNHI